MSTIIYIGNFGFPEKNASGKRVLGNCLCFQKLGYQIVCISHGTKDYKKIFNMDSYTIDVGNSVTRVLRHNIERIIEVFECVKSSDAIAAVVIYGAIYTQRENCLIIKWCKKNNVKIVYDQVDWFELNWHNPFRAIVRAINNYYMNKKVIPQCDGVICISHFLEKYHQSQGRKTVVVPPLATTNNTLRITKSDDSRPIRISYAGTSSDKNRAVHQWKDRIDLVFKHLAQVQKDENLRSFIFDVYGLTVQQYIDMFPKRLQRTGLKILKQLGDHVIFHGMVDNLEAIEGIRNSDFTILLREKKRSTMAGFPTKVSESISNGTPVICNDTSDISYYLEGTDMAIIVKDNEIDIGLKKILSLTDYELIKMRKSCENNPFYYLNYSSVFKSFFSSIEIH